MGEMFKQRYVGIDALRTFAILCVILNHCTENIYVLTLNGVGSMSLLSQIFAFCSYTLGRVGVPCFLTISGYLLMDRSYSAEQCRKFWTHNWFRLLVCAWVWFSIYDLILLAQGHDITLNRYLKEMMLLEQVEFSHVWYLPTILGLYLFLPVISNGVHRLGWKYVAFPVAVAAVYCFGVPFLNAALPVVTGGGTGMAFDSGFSGGAYGIYLLMGALVKKGAFKRMKGPIVALVALLSYGGTVWFQLWSYQSQCPYNVWYDFPLLLVVGVCLLELTSRIQTLPGERVLAVLAKYSFGVYLIHNILLGQLRPWVLEQSWIMPWKVLLLFCIISVFSYLASLLVGRIPKVGPYLLYLKSVPKSKGKTI